ncbi:MAG: amino acid permease, partial [Lachnospiraceae bacterium]|nr:amino acid permease [Lachnospiraceae bacterium]
IFFIVLLGPWAFAGFESISHSVEEYKFNVKKTLPIMVASLAVAALSYGALAMIASSGVPEGFRDWTEYVENAGSLEGFRSIPAFNGIHSVLGVPGLVILGVAAAAGIITGLVGNLTAAGRMVFAMARDGLLPKPMAKLNRNGSCANAILFLIILSLPIPFLGRSALGWVIDTNTIGVIIAYAYTSAAALKIARKDKRPFVVATGIVGLAVSLFFLLFFLIPTEWSVSTLANESYFMLLVWLLLGFVMYYLVFRWDKKQRIGRSVFAWAVMLALIFATSLIWIRESAGTIARDVSKEIIASGMNQEIVEEKVASVAASVVNNTAFQFFVVLASLSIIFIIYLIVQKRHQTAVADKNIAENSSQAKSTFLSNMSHDIRTPMNAIVGYVTLAKREKDLSPAVREYLGKIEASSDHLLALINDVLEMSRIESGRMELAPVPTDLSRVMSDVRNLFSTAMASKGLSYKVETENVTHQHVLLDANRFNRILMNLISNAFKYTPKGGSVSVVLSETGSDEGRASYRLSVKDTGIGMSPEFAARVFDAYERERTATVESIQGTGLGMAITKSIVDLMGGTIGVVTEKGKGSEFIVTFELPLDENASGKGIDEADHTDADRIFSGLKLLLVEDDPDNMKVAKALFEEAGFEVDAA